MKHDPVVFMFDLFVAALDGDDAKMREMTAPLDREQLERLLLTVPGPVVNLLLTTIRGGTVARRRRKLRDLIRQTVRERARPAGRGEDDVA
ncbi:hypothetical protein [Streptosporangium sp. G12]